MTSSFFFDKVAEIMTKTAKAVREVRGDCDRFVKEHVERALEECSVVSRDEFDRLRRQFDAATRENEGLKARLEALEKQCGVIPPAE